jgi:hypothetical protein
MHHRQPLRLHRARARHPRGHGQSVTVTAIRVLTGLPDLLQYDFVHGILQQINLCPPGDAGVRRPAPERPQMCRGLEWKSGNLETSEKYCRKCMRYFIDNGVQMACHQGDPTMPQLGFRIENFGIRIRIRIRDQICTELSIREFWHCHFSAWISALNFDLICLSNKSFIQTDSNFNLNTKDQKAPI